MTGIELIAFIIARGRSKELIRLCRKEGVAFTAVLHGMGTASREILSLIGIGDTEKDVVLLTVLREQSAALKDRLAQRMRLDEPGGGIAFSVPLSAAASQMDSVSMLSGSVSDTASKANDSVKTYDNEGGHDMQKKHELVVTLVNRGFADQVMAAARAVGATGGTVINARGSGKNELQKFFGSVIEPEKEMVLILVEASIRSAVMEAIANEAGLAKEGKGVCFALPVTSTSGMRE